MISGATNATYAIAAVSPGDAGTFSVQVISPLATTLSTNVQLTVISPAAGAAVVAKSFPSASARLLIESANDGVVTIILRGPPGDVYRLERSADLVRWQDVTTLTLDVSGEIMFRDVATEPQQFYRVRAK